ncbi:MAG TPA: heme exporter protein CcmD [Solimonas sp.]|jgi:heme exporter protein CcmD|nr:heme exporter protein CcmD [Solimonas sp.]
MSAEFWQMSGYGLYVWGSFAAALVVHLLNWWWPRQVRKSLNEESLDE